MDGQAREELGQPGCADKAMDFLGGMDRGAAKFHRERIVIRTGKPKLLVGRRRFDDEIRRFYGPVPVVGNA